MASAAASTSAWYSDPDFVAARQRTVPAGGLTDYGMFIIASISFSLVLGESESRRGKEMEESMEIKEKNKELTYY